MLRSISRINNYSELKLCNSLIFVIGAAHQLV